MRHGATGTCCSRPRPAIQTAATASLPLKLAVLLRSTLWDQALRHAAEKEVSKEVSKEVFISLEEWQRGKDLFLEKRKGQFLQPNEAREILDRSQLPHSELSQIWSLSAQGPEPYG